MSATAPEPVAGSGLRLALALLTVLPVGRPAVTRRSAARAMAWAPAVGLGLGLAGGGVLAAATWSGLPSLVAATLAVGSVAVLTRGLHLDGLADTADGLGSGRPAADALAVMRTGDVGPFGVVTVVLVLLLQVGAAAQGGPWALLAAVTAGRAAMTLACRSGVAPARPDGLGALVAGSVPTPVAVLAVLVALVAGLPLGWPGPGAVLLALVAAALLVRHAVRRLGGVTGDVLGAAGETAVTVTLVVAATG